MPTPPPELPTPTPGSQNPENPLFTGELTPVRATPLPEFKPLHVPPGHIYFVRDGNLWRVAPDGSAEKRLSDLQVSNPPAPSPDGTRVAFTSDRALYVLPSEGGEARKLATGELASPQRLGWSRDGALVGYIAYDLTTNAEQAWAVPLAGGDPALLATLPRGAAGRGPVYERSVKWSPDGNWLTVSGANNPMLVLRWPLASGHPNDRREVAGGEPDWSPDSRDLVYAESLNGALGIFTVLDSGATPFRNEQQLVGTRLGEYAQGPGPLWSPASSGGDGDLIAYRSRSQEGEEPQVAIRRRGGRELQPLPGNTNNPSWSPGGDRLVVETGHVTRDTLGAKWGPDGLAIVQINFAPEGLHAITMLVKNGRWPVWGR